MSLSNVSVPVTVAARTPTFPGMTTSGRPLVVVPRAAFLAANAQAGDLVTSPELWVRGDASGVLARLRAAGVPTGEAATAAAIRQLPALLAMSWTFGFLLALGLTAALVVAVGLVLYLQSRQAARDLAFALGRRMGLSDRTHRRAVTVELAAMLAVAFVLGGGLAVAAAAIVRGKLDLLPDVPGPTVLAVPWALLGAIAVGAALTAVAGGVLAQRRARRTKVSEVLRLAA
jgi:predicted lysophospholipase L1 biosynthesis ABC-type transport system permease subunit